MRRDSRSAAVIPIVRPARRKSRRIGRARRDRRGEILARATTLFADAGVANVSMNDIADAVGIQKPSLYYFFPSKQELLRAVLRPLVDEPYQELRAIAEGSGEPAAKVVDAMVALGRAFGRYRSGMEILVREKLERHLSPEAFREIMREKAAYTELWRRILREGVRSGCFAPLDDKIIAFAAIGALDWMYAWFDPAGELSGEEIARQIASTFLGGLLAGRPKGMTRRKPRSRR
jgi:TetR/AcrR family transcriptional regulator, cholesterol catabolism regulator